MSAPRYQRLARDGQSPETLIIACCDSRAAPGTIFNSFPGEIFVIRNVANLVPLIFVAAREKENRLRLFGAWFDISSGELWITDPATGVFRLANP